MKSIPAYTLSISALACALLCSCAQEDEVPPLNTSKATKATTVVAQKADDEPQLVPIKSLSDAPKEEAKPVEPIPAEEAKVVPEAKKEAEPAAPAAIHSVSKVKPKEDGQYVIQCGLEPTKKSADAIVKKLAENNVEAYVVEVNNPGELEGTFYRIRIGFFSSLSNAQQYGKDILSPLKFDWWVDNFANDKNGHPFNVDAASEPAPAPAAKPTPAPAPAPAAKPAPAPAPAAKPAPAPAAKAAANDTIVETVETVIEAPAPEVEDDWE